MAGMKVFAAALLALAVLVSAISAVPVTYSCDGASQCKSIPQSECNAARREIQPNNRYFSGGSSTGVCQGHCGLFVAGSNCDLTGNEMITAFNELRSRDCQKCGVKTFDDGCKFVMNYVTGCDSINGDVLRTI